ncbi:DnaJ heat shock amino-terminal domain protein [Actinidia rufa]|uniref:DnaJ heat shock amino-terminal domain protein n=1 Tax=Actinidia rufa TaxID=165716 RepID=A0A7J0G391_9ERIC|nr:DnaJ heat shock amino-terminal domain protein [Actinidia rufa]
MEPNKEEALRAIRYAEKRFAEKDFTGARNYALKAQMLFPELEGISQMVATFDKMAVLLHPDKNKTVGADGAFKLVSEAWTLLSDSKMRNSYDLRRKRQVSSGSSVSHGLATFWTLCTSCQVQYEYLRKYLNKKLSCKNCRGVFIAVETGAGPVNGSFPYCPPSCVPDNGYGSHAYNGVTYGPTTAVYFAGNGVSGFHPGHGSEYVSNVSFQWGSFPGASSGAVDPNGLNVKSASVVHQANGNGSRPRSNGKHEIKKTAAGMCSNAVTAYNEPSVGRVRGPYKKRKLDVGGASRNGNEELASKTTSEVTIVNGNGSTNSKLGTISNTQTRRYSAAPAFDARKLLMDKARAEIRKNLEELRLASAAAAATGEKNMKASDEVGKSIETFKKEDLAISVRQSELKKTGSTSITVPDSDFHDFDKDRSEDCFKPKQIWALYDEEDGMPRLYCLIREIISVKPFKIHISYLNSKTDIEFGLVNWMDSGFTKSCGNFRAWNSDVVEQVNVFSHLLSKEKAGRGGCIKIYPRSGDIWAVYRHWSAEWDRTTPDEVRHQYEMVEVLDDYSEALGVCVVPLIKLDGFKTVYQRNMNKSAIRWIPRREMVRFSHMVPSWLLKEGTNLPEGCWDLDPAATPDELLVAAPEAKTEDEPCQAERDLDPAADSR